MTDDSIPEDFQNWWDSDEKEWPDPYIRKHSALWWAYQGWIAGQKVEREECLEKVRIRIMREAYDFADDDNSETYNALKVMCSDVLKLIRARGNDE